MNKKNEGNNKSSITGENKILFKFVKNECLLIGCYILMSPHRARAHEALEKAYATFPPEEARALRWSAHFYEKAIERLLERQESLEGRRIVDAGTGRGLLPIALRFLGAEAYGLEKYVFDFSESDMFKEWDEQALLRRWQECGVHPLV